MKEKETTKQIVFPNVERWRNFLLRNIDMLKKVIIANSYAAIRKYKHLLCLHSVTVGRHLYVLTFVLRTEVPINILSPGKP